ncbi:MAG: methyltransferase domain-containing protein [Theionarchaea archaeon]|nr:methyltransferase domain-containing protein [Theionarchaea archaeon]
MSSQPHVTRVSRSKQEARNSYDTMSALYDIMASSEQKYNEMGVQQLTLTEGEDVLEIGFGTGQCLLSIVQLVGHTGVVCGIDISEGMSRRAQRKIQEAGLSQEMLLTIGDAAHLPFHSGQFDAILMTFTLELFDTPEIPVVLHECSRVLKSEGRMCVVGLSKKNAGIAVTVYEWIHRLIPKYVDCRPIFIEKSLQNAGFTIIDTIHLTMWGLPVEIVLAQNP